MEIASPLIVAFPPFYREAAWPPSQPQVHFKPHTAVAGQLLIFLPTLAEFWDYRHAIPSPAGKQIFFFFLILH